MEDEECLPENSSLKLYLQNLGFSDLQVTKSTPANPSSVKFELSKSKVKQPYVETIDEDVIEQINIIISTRMLFEEDISNIEKLLSNFKVVKNGMLKSMFKDFYSFVVILLGLCLHWVVGYYAFFIVASFYAFMATNYLRHRHFNRKRLKRLASVLHTNFVLLKKTVKFIEENNLVKASETNKNISTEFMDGFNFYKNFKSEFFTSVNEMINILMHSTQELIKKIPLCDYIENPEYYLCNNFNKNYEFVDLTKLYEVYLLVQSEFLQRLILSIIPNIKSRKEDFYEFSKIITDTYISLLKIKKNLNKKFKFVFLNGIHSPKAKINFKLPCKGTSGISYYRDLVLNLHEASKIFQNLLLQCRILEEKIMSEKINDIMEEELFKIQKDLLACQRNISDSFILLKRVNLIKNSEKFDKVKIQDEEEVRNSAEKLNKIRVGYTDLDPKVEDEIFEIYFTSENFDKTLSDIEDWNLDYKLEKKVAKQYSENVMKELKLKLVEKADHWKKREKELLMKKGIIDVEENKFKQKQQTNSIEEEQEHKEKMENGIKEPDLEMCLKGPEVKFGQNYFFNDTKDLEHLKINGNKKEFASLPNETIQALLKSSIKFQTQTNHIDYKCLEISKNFEMEMLNSSNEDSKFENTQENSTQMFNRDFINDLNQAREKIFKSSFAVEEELFCASEEDLSSEDNPT